MEGKVKLVNWRVKNARALVYVVLNKRLSMLRTCGSGRGRVSFKTVIKRWE